MAPLRLRKPLRLSGHDYAAPGAYFVTLVTVDRRALFGDVVDGQVRLNAVGETVARTWRDMPAHYRNIALDEFIVMPNHFHGVIVLELGNLRALPHLVGAFKRISARAAGQNLWHRSYHDRIVRDERELAAVREYIVNNPAQWALDEENPDHLS